MLSTTRLQSQSKTFLSAANQRLGLLIVSGLLALVILVVPMALRPASYPLQIGDVASQDIQAPYALTYQSAVRTEQARKDAEATIPGVYLPADPSITRRQLERLRIALTYINTVRADAYASHWQQINDLQQLSDVTLSQESAETILTMSDARWQVVQQETMKVLESAMRNTIRENRVDEVLRSLPSLISFALQEDQSELVVSLVKAYLVPNSLYSPEQTEKARQDVRAAVEPVSRSFVPGETIVYRGQIIEDEAWEALEKFGMVEPENYREEMIGAGALVVLLSGFIGLYMYRRTALSEDTLKSLALIAVLLLVFLLGARLTIPNRTVVPYLFPATAFGLTIAVLFNTEYGLVFSLVLSILAGYNLPNAPDLSFFYILSSFCGVLVLGKARRVANFFWAGIAAGLAGAAVVFAYRLPDSITDWIGIATLIGSSIFNGMASASLALLFQFLFAQALGMTTALQLLEISRPDHPLLQFLLRNAPGTYQHSLQVANLAEQAAEAIGADTLLTRVGALYHDAGKAINSPFFIENQVAGELNPHDDLDPCTSAGTIIRHVTYGLQLAQKYHLPPGIRDFISEHHGTLLTRYQYTRALEAAGNDPQKVDPEKFRYPGPKPRSRETALLMLADGCEARSRAERPKDEAELKVLINRVFEYCQREGQLDQTRLTLLDLNVAAESFFNSMRGMYHPRILYPELKQTVPQPGDVPSLQDGLDPGQPPESISTVQQTP